VLIRFVTFKKVCMLLAVESFGNTLISPPFSTTKILFVPSPECVKNTGFVKPRFGNALTTFTWASAAE
jgi:hypothetical protein